MSKDKKCCKNMISVGGQALIEGIMMQGPQGAAISVRTPDRTIDTEKIEFKRVKDKFKPLGWPIIRGVVSYIETMIFGYKCLMISADKSGLEDIESTESDSKLDKWLNDHLNKKVMGVITALASVLGIGLAFILFFYLPTLAADFINKLSGGNLDNFRALFEGVMRMVIFVLYIALVSLMKDIKRTFMYHGAEHKTIFCYENELALNVENVRKMSRFHPRCGTSFIFVIIIISVIISSAISVAFPELRDQRLVWMAIKLLILPLITGISYEFIKYAGKHDNAFVKVLAAPGLWMQRLTTKEPDDEMIEVAIEAFKAVVDDYKEDYKALTVKQLFNESLKELEKIENAEFECREIFKKFLEMDDTAFLLNSNTVVDAEKYIQIKKAVKKRATHYPLQYILGEWDFCGLSFNVGENVLIPRPETEELTYKLIDMLKENKKDDIHIIDLCAGSGCIATSIKYHLPDVDVTMVERSLDAVRYIDINYTKYKLGYARIIAGDVFNIEHFTDLPMFDLIVSNPPYIKTSEMATLQKEVKFEPSMALDGGKDGLDFYRCICDDWCRYLAKDGIVAFECGEGQTEDIINMLGKNGISAQAHKDFRGVDRFVIGRKI